MNAHDSLPDEYWENLAERLSDPDRLRPKTQTSHSPSPQEIEKRTQAIKHLSSEEAIDYVLSKGGRPRIGTQPHGRSPLVRASISKFDKERLGELAKETGKKESELVREAVLAMLAQHEKAS